MSPDVVLLVAVASMVAYGVVAYSVRARARASRPPAVAEVGGLARYSPYFIFVPYLVLAWRIGPEIELPDPLRAAGLALVIAGPALMIWSAVTLGRHFDVDVLVHGAHEVVRAGPYSVVRHPIYTGIALHFLGLSLASGSLVVLAGTLFAAIPALYQRASAEELLLRETLGDAYDRYARDVPMLVPFLR